MNVPDITLISFGYFEKHILEKVAKTVGGEYNCFLNLREGHIDLSEFFDPVRRQYNGNSLLKFVDALPVPGTGKTMGLFSVDLYIPILTYIFGQAYLGGHSGIASLYRLNNESYGMQADPDLLLDRFKKEVIHELGHTFGLIHCNVPTCVMRSSTYVEEIDQKDQSLCPVCRKKAGM